jgi:hypothetical protein
MSVQDGDGGSSGLADRWLDFWFTPADPRPLAVVRILAAGLGLMLLWSYASDLQRWFGPEGMIDVATATAWRSPFGFSLYDFAGSAATVRLVFAITVVVFLLLLVGCGTPLVSLVAPVLWASLMHRGPMLAGAADDCLAVLLWCLAIGRSGRGFSVDRLLAARAGRTAASPSVRCRIAEGLLLVHAAAIAVAAALSQLKGDVWWNGTAAWWLAVRQDAPLIPVQAAYAASEYLTNLVTHAIPLFEIAFAIGIWPAATRTACARAGLVFWPLVGLMAGEPAWGLAVATMGVPAALRPGPTLRPGAALRPDPDAVA